MSVPPPSSPPSGITPTTADAEGFKGKSLEWSGLSFSIGNKLILNNVTGILEAGSLTAVLGPSGCGKSTLMNILAGRQNTGGSGRVMKGDVSVGGRTVEPAKFRSNIAYVMQDDAHVATSTPKEALEFSAKLRSDNTSQGGAPVKIKGKVEELLHALRLEKCQSTLIGNELIKGVSGGERKRASIGVELVTSPAVLFLDEPLSGLDSYAAYTTVLVLKNQIAREGGTPVLCTVHQPSSEIFDQFDNVLLLHPNGRVVYHGPTDELTSFLAEKHGKNCPSNYNPADFVLFLFQTSPIEDLDKMADYWDQYAMENVFPVIEEKRKAWELANEESNVKAENLRKPRTSGLTQMLALLKREVADTYRNPVALIIRYGLNIFLSVLFGAVFWRVGQDQPESYFRTDSGQSEFKSYYGAVVSLCISTMMGNAQTVLLSFPLQRGVFLREYATNMYSSIAYFAAKTVVELPLTFIHSLIQMVVSYFMMNLQGNFVWYVMILWLLAIAANSTALLLSCMVSSAENAIQLLPAVFVPQILFSGLFIDVSNIPDWLRWVQYVCFLKYAMNLAFINEFPDFDYLASQNNINYNSVGLYVGVLAALVVVFRVLAIVALRSKARFVY